MDLGQIYMASPDWIKALMVILPFVTFYGTARLFRAGRGAVPELEPAATKVRHVPVTPLRSAEVPLLQQARGSDPADLDLIGHIESLPAD